MTKAEIIKNYMDKLQITAAEAEQLFEDDKRNYIGDEGEKITNSARKNRHREESDKERATTRKIDADKKELFDNVRILLEGMELNQKITDVTPNKETEISFNYNGCAYTWKLIKHRPPKK